MIPIRVLAGPTASGKGEIARKIALEMDAEIISVDSMKIFRGMDVCTAKPTAVDRDRIPHHLIDVADPWESFSVARWLPLCEHAIREVLGKGKVPLLVVGTPLYLRSLIFGLFPGPSARWDLREQWLEEAKASGTGVLHRRLQEVDPDTASRTHPNDLRRIVRALEVYGSTGRPISELQAEARRESPYEARMVGILWPREELHRRIERRVAVMFERGLIEEVRRLRSSPKPLARQALQAVGLKEVMEHFDGEITEEEALFRVQRQTRRLARHQMTWFRKFTQIQWVDAEMDRFPVRVAADVIKGLSPEERGSGRR